MVTLPLPRSLSPSKVATFKECALAFRFAVIEGLPEPPSPRATKGTLVHRALELLMLEPPSRRSLATGLACLQRAREELRDHPEYSGLGLTPEAEAEFEADAEELVRRYFALENPAAVRPIGLELRMEAEVGNLRLRGVIDRLELDDVGELVVTDYKTGRAPGTTHEQSRLGGVHFYAFLCQQVLGRRPARIQLLYLAEPVAIVARPSEQSIRGMQQRAEAVWRAVERACEHDDFRPRPSPLCEWCSFRAYCPAFGGNPSDASELAARAV